MKTDKQLKQEVLNKAVAHLIGAGNLHGRVSASEERRQVGFNFTSVTLEAVSRTREFFQATEVSIMPNGGSYAYVVFSGVKRFPWEM